jgi:hypothetical protein
LSAADLLLNIPDYNGAENELSAKGTLAFSAQPRPRVGFATAGTRECQWPDLILARTRNKQFRSAPIKYAGGLVVSSVPPIFIVWGFSDEIWSRPGRRARNLKKGHFGTTTSPAMDFLPSASPSLHVEQPQIHRRPAPEEVHSSRHNSQDHKDAQYLTDATISAILSKFCH